MPPVAMWAALLAGALAAVFTGALWLLVVGVVLSTLLPSVLRARQRRRYQRVLAWIFGVMLALLVLWVVMIAIAAATGQIE
jgi:NADH:ubiquinone oxidoreductase subunit 6 (subunit J)